MSGAREADRKEQFAARLKHVNVVYAQEMHNDDNMKLNGDTLLSVQAWWAEPTIYSLVPSPQTISTCVFEGRCRLAKVFYNCVVCVI